MADELIESLDEQSHIKRPRLSINNRQSDRIIARLENLKKSVHGRFVYVGVGYGLCWRVIEIAFESRILTGAVINSKHIEPRQFLEDASEIMLKHMHSVMQRYDSIKINTVFNSEFVASDKRANKSIATRNYINAPICASGTDRVSSSLLYRWKSFRNAIANGHYHIYEFNGERE